MNDLQRTSSLAVPAALSQPETDSRCQFHNHWMSESHSGYERAWTASTAPTKHNQSVNVLFSFTVTKKNSNQKSNGLPR